MAETTGGQNAGGRSRPAWCGRRRAEAEFAWYALSGPTDLETGGGSIYLTQVDSAVKASTGAGLITAWFVAPVKSPEPCANCSPNDGDIVVYIPRQLPVTIDAQVNSQGMSIA